MKKDFGSVEYRLSTMQRMFNGSKLVSSGCVEWVGSKRSHGYGQISYMGESVTTHRLSFMFANGFKRLTSKQYICHSCDNPSCINPEHLWLGDAKSNSQDCVKKGRHRKAVNTQCRYGHAFSGHNLMINNKTGIRRCRTCFNKSVVLNRQKGVLYIAN